MNNERQDGPFFDPGQRKTDRRTDHTMSFLTLVIGMPGGIGIRKKRYENDQYDAHYLKQIFSPLSFHHIQYHNTYADKSLLQRS